MKNILFFFLLLGAISDAIAQDGLSIIPAAGIGITNTIGKIAHDNLDMEWSKPPASLSTLNPQLLIGYEKNKWSITIGLSYLKTGYQEHYKYWELGEFEVKNKEEFYHFLFPLSVARTYSVGKHFFFSPGVGFAISYNTANKESGSTNDLNNNPITYNSTLSKQQFNFSYKRISYWGILKAYVGYNVNNRLSLLAGPEFQCMLAPMGKSTGNYASDDLRQYALTFVVGGKWTLKKATARK